MNQRLKDFREYIRRRGIASDLFLTRASHSFYKEDPDTKAIMSLPNADLKKELEGLTIEKRYGRTRFTNPELKSKHAVIIWSNGEFKIKPCIEYPEASKARCYMLKGYFKTALVYASRVLMVVTTENRKLFYECLSLADN